jgi:hypothetical protein
LIIAIITNNHFPEQLAQLFPIFANCHTFDQFFDVVVNAQHWMVLLMVRQWKYYNELRHADESIQLRIEYKQSREWIERYGIEANRTTQLHENIKTAILLINTFIQTQAVDAMVESVKRHWNLFELFDNSDCKQQQFELIAYATLRIVQINCIQVYTKQTMDINTVAIDNLINRLLHNLNSSFNQQD